MTLPMTCVIPTLRPGSEVVDAARGLRDQVASVVISDDASPCTSDGVLRDLDAGAVVIRHSVRAGIARGLNDGLVAAQEAGHSWLLTLDQDTRMSIEAITELFNFAERAILTGSDVGVVAPRTVHVGDETITYPEVLRNELLTTYEVFQSAALWNVPRLGDVGGFDESLGMDAVDAAACLRLREQGALIVLAPGVSIDHSWGDAEFVRLAGQQIAVTHHDAARRYTIVRNRLRLAPAEFRQSPRHALRTLRRVASSTLLAALVERDRWAKIRASASGVRQARSH